jgi:hypothetical protein
MNEASKVPTFLRPLNRVSAANRRVGSALAGPCELNQLHHHFSENGRKFNWTIGRIIPRKNKLKRNVKHFFHFLKLKMAVDSDCLKRTEMGG